MNVEENSSKFFPFRLTKHFCSSALSHSTLVSLAPNTLAIDMWRLKRRKEKRNLITKMCVRISCAIVLGIPNVIRYAEESKMVNRNWWNGKKADARNSITQSIRFGCDAAFDRKFENWIFSGEDNSIKRNLMTPPFDGIVNQRRWTTFHINRTQANWCVRCHHTISRWDAGREEILFDLMQEKCSSFFST